MNNNDLIYRLRDFEKKYPKDDVVDRFFCDQHTYATKAEYTPNLEYFREIVCTFEAVGNIAPVGKGDGPLDDMCYIAASPQGLWLAAPHPEITAVPLGMMEWKNVHDIVEVENGDIWVIVSSLDDFQIPVKAKISQSPEFIHAIPSTGEVAIRIIKDLCCPNIRQYLIKKGKLTNKPFSELPKMKSHIEVGRYVWLIILSIIFSCIRTCSSFD